MNRNRSFILLKTAAVLAVAVLFAACLSISGEVKKEKSAGENWQQKRLGYYNDSIFPAAVKTIRTGDMITRLGTDITSELLRQLNLKDQSFSHCGIASIEHDTVFVYHAIGGEFNPNQKLKRETLYSFCHPSENKAIGVFEMRLNNASTAEVVQFAQATFKKETPFDMDFDYATDDRLYCAEFVAKGYSHAIKDSSWFHFTRKQNFLYVSVDNLFLNERAKKKLQLSY